MLVHGIADDNVYFAHSLQLVKALFEHGKSFELLPLVGLTHQLSDPGVRQKLFDRIVSFFEGHLGAPCRIGS
jgi:dipeptidyl-peptidase-4